MSKKFWTLDKQGNEVLRDLEKENEEFTLDRYYAGEFDSSNYMWMEMFNSFVYDDNGCDYERMGCFIKEGDVVLDVGGNIGIFAHRAELRGASKVFSFEPMTPTFNCLIKNKGPKTNVYKMAVGSENKWFSFNIHSDFTNVGGASKKDLISSENIIHEEKVFMIDINEIFNGLVDKIDFMKVDIEGGEVELLNAILDENLNSLRCLACEFHRMNEEFDIFQENFINRMSRLGFRSFVLFMGDGNLRTVTFWRE